MRAVNTLLVRGLTIISVALPLVNGRNAKAQEAEVV